ncbi:MAG: HlyC/CorC family transporter [Verrucomicrobiaceae bacterium]|nr:HlyC/CorC family transporter [Verrucomicrobiaceae bacterium]
MSLPLIISLLVLYTVLLIVLGIVSAMETATFSAKDAGIQVSRLKAGSLRDSVLAILSNPFHHVHRTLLVSAALNLALTTLILFLAFDPLRKLGYSPWVTAPGLFAFTVFAGDVLPKLIAVRSPAKVLVRTARMLYPLRKVLDPLAVLAERASDLILSIVVPRNMKTRHSITMEELETLIEMREEQGSIDPSEAAILNEVFDIADLTVRDCMVPRVDLEMVDASSPEAKVHDTLDRASARFVILYAGTPDSVTGVVDAHEWKLAGRPAWSKVIQQPVFVPETFSALEALTRHLGSPAQCLLICDEYGGLEGMVTQEEIVDWMLYDAAPWQGETPEVRASDEQGQRHIADGAARLDHIADLLDVPLEEPGIDTIGGLVFNHLGYMPKPGERIRLQGLEIKVRRATRRRIQQVEIRLQPKAPSAEDSQPLVD